MDQEQQVDFLFCGIVVGGLVFLVVVCTIGYMLGRSHAKETYQKPGPAKYRLKLGPLYQILYFFTEDGVCYATVKDRREREPLTVIIPLCDSPSLRVDGFIELGRDGKLSITAHPPTSTSLRVSESA